MGPNHRATATRFGIHQGNVQLGTRKVDGKSAFCVCLQGKMNVIVDVFPGGQHRFFGRECRGILDLFAVKGGQQICVDVVVHDPVAAILGALREV